MGTLPSLSLEGRVAIVTGGKMGLGRVIALLFAEAGADVAICSRVLTDGRLEATAEEIRKLGRRSLAIQADVSRKANVDNMVKKVVAEFSTIDILVNNAGIYLDRSWLELSEEDWDLIHGTHLKGPYLCSQAAGKVMAEQKRGSIVNIASVMGLRPIRRSGAYDTAKAGLLMLTSSLSLELGDYNIRVNAIASGYIRTEMNEYIFQQPEYLKALQDATILGRMAEPIEIATVALFLASDASSYMTGSTVLADGGFLWQWPIR